MNGQIISTTLSNNTKIYYNVVLTFKSIKSGKDYIVYTDNTYDNQNKIRLYAAIYNPNLLNPFVSEPVTKEEWEEITRVIDSVILEK